jgi:MFS family permease
MGATRDDIEAWFIRRGLPHLIDRYRANVDIWHRSFPTLVVVAVITGAANALNRRYSTGTNVAAVLATVAASLVFVGAVNWRWGGRITRWPDRVGPLSLGLLALIAALPSEIFGGQWRFGLTTLIAFGLLLALTYAITSYGLIPMTRWAFSALFDQLADVGSLIARALPLLLLFVTFLFINTEVWQVASALDGWRYPLVLASFFAVGAFFVIGRLPLDVAEIGAFANEVECRRLAIIAKPVLSTPLSSIELADGNEDGYTVALSRRQLLNVGLVLLFSQALVVTIVGVTVFVFFAAFGTQAIRPSVVEAWIGSTGTLIGPSWLNLTVEVLRVAGFLGAFSALYFTVYLVTDENYRREFRANIISDVRSTLAVCAVYRTLPSD